MADDGESLSPASTIGPRSAAETVLFTFVPVAGSISYEIFSANITNPGQFIKLFSPFELIVANGLWFNSHLGVGLYIFSRKHIATASVPYRVLYSALGSVIFNFGSVLLWATGKAVLPPHPPTRVAFGALSGLVFLSLGYSYFRFVDALCLRCLPFNGRVVDTVEEEVD
ncbi:uncharacterized protein LOC135461610 [Liolophura sinensis]|uniref:uncharacterized protein LOC135461610 n=1 Tax=Liolophura sinensis TaxID=3198878 RepID=UPI0031598420